jgi:hypothetical protein
MQRPEPNGLLGVVGRTLRAAVRAIVGRSNETLQRARTPGTNYPTEGGEVLRDSVLGPGDVVPSRDEGRSIV